MPAHTKITYAVLLTIVRRLWDELGHAPSANAVSKAAGGGASARIHHAITAVGIEHGLNVRLYATLPEELRVLVTEPKAPADSGPDADGTPELAEAVHSAVAQLRSACAAVERKAREDAEERVAAAEARMAADLDAMDRRLREAAADADAAAQTHAEAAAEYERQLKELSTDLAGAREEVAGRKREHEHLARELEVARANEREAQRQREKALAEQQSAAERFAGELATVTERALHAEAERDAARQLSDRLAADLDRVRSDADAAIARATAEVAGLRAELTAAQQALHDVERARAVADALLAASRSNGTGAAAAP